MKATYLLFCENLDRWLLFLYGVAMNYTEKEATEIIRAACGSEQMCIRLHSYKMWLSEESIKMLTKEIVYLDAKEDQLFEEYK
jgi:hypothetical protein